MGSTLNEIRNGFNNTTRRLAHDALRRVNPGAALKYPASIAIDALTTPIHIGKDATDMNPSGRKDWDARSLVIGTKSATAKDGSAISLGDAKAKGDSNAISVNGKAQSGKGGTSVSLRAKGATSAGKNKKVYSSTHNEKQRESHSSHKVTANQLDMVA